MMEPRAGAISWDECFMRMTHIISERSKDPKTQVGAVVVDQKNVVVGMGYNGFPRGIESDQLPWEREGKPTDTKYGYICHAEENAIYNANTSTNDCKVYCNLFPCNECAKTLIQKGIVEVIYEDDKYHDTDSCIMSRRLFELAGVKYRQYICEWTKNKITK